VQDSKKYKFKHKIQPDIIVLKFWETIGLFGTSIPMCVAIKFQPFWLLLYIQLDGRRNDGIYNRNNKEK